MVFLFLMKKYSVRNLLKNKNRLNYEYTMIILGQSVGASRTGPSAHPVKSRTSGQARQG